MTHEEIELDLKKQHIAGNAYAIITICSLFLMGFGIYQFVGYLSTQESMLTRIDSRNKVVSDLRIQNCHRIQEDGVVAMGLMSTAMVKHTEAMFSMQHSVDDLRKSVDRNTHKIEQLILK